MIGASSICIRAVAAWAMLSAASCASARSAPIVVGTGGTSTVRVGQTVKLATPSFELQWSVSFDESRLEPIAGAGKVSPPDGWAWKALQPGQTEIILTAKPAPCPTPPCGPNVPRITVPIEIVKQ